MNNTDSKLIKPKFGFAVALFGCASLFATSGDASAQSRTRTRAPGSNPPIKESVMVAPAFENYTQDLLFGDVWKRPDLSQRDRSIVTIAVLISRNATMELPSYLNRALDAGVKPGEISEIITHLAFYSGWPNAAGAGNAAKTVFADRHINAAELPPAKVALLPLDKEADARRARTVDENFGKVSPGVVQYTTDALFQNLWLRPGLAPRDRSMITVSALVASGQVAQITYHLNRAMDNGLTQKEAGEMLTQLAFYTGWPNVFSAMPVFKEVFEKRPGSAVK
jgi:4-carboxymuconolactone decarboxylase